MECRWSKAIASLKLASAIKDFGASDCRCSSHLTYFEFLPQIDLKRDYRIIYPDY
ncbi:MAG: DUF123 domain-containing protein [Gammaproteobacteria bacterium]|nr:DUF123 domain-containing protein [Gammaproteobacteria bacterium]MBT5202028.1 DUF123 domain-containing protein [Gammaproteobacteria bacterium]MBT5600736.1 DUF123 domain-containing protein [Gammaproteobacteria bacterium]MBT6244300.1 DUF123 domain-containing protein [Gammaproteobacteria bacterium]